MLEILFLLPLAIAFGVIFGAFVLCVGLVGWLFCLGLDTLLAPLVRIGKRL